MLQRISHRLALLILVALAGLWLASGNGLFQLIKSRDAIEAMGDNVVPSILILESAQLRFMKVRTTVLNHILLKGDAAKAAMEQQLQQERGGVEKDLKDYEALLDDDEDRRLLGSDRQALADYFTHLERALDLSRQQQTEAAQQYATSTLKPAADHALAAFAAHVEYNRHLTAIYKQQAERDYRAAFWLTLTLVLATTLVLGWNAFATYKAVAGTANEASRQVARVASELDFSRTIPVSGRDEIADLLRAFNGLIERLREGLGTIRHDAEQLASASLELAGSAQQVTSSSLAQSEASSAMAANVEEVTVSINHVSSRTNEANQLTREAGDLALEGRESVVSTVARIEAVAGAVDEAAQQMALLEESGRQISAVVNVIKDVAEQTNLLALNAAIEAARAGEQGRGFAVVADEVRKLAERTASSTGEIAGMVEAIQQRSAEVSARMAQAVASVRQGVGEGAGTRDAMDRIAGSAAQSNSLVEEIAGALREQSSASNAIAGQVERVAQMAEENSRAAERSTELSVELQRLASAMSQVVAAYRL
ncbi:methyl-accepting chemotaxis protein [Chitinimonas sp.]|uniref:methyl-accepting chemotaxis protein n=1 Tax=Chitinimonas sp. TaxID=1934313 RepID=UPI002F935294